MCDIDLEPARVWSETHRKARKKHRCSCCGGRIAPGSGYVVHFSVCDETVASEKICVPCTKDRGAFADAHDAMICTPSYFQELLGSCVADGDPESDKRWRPMIDALRTRGAAHG